MTSASLKTKLGKDFWISSQRFFKDIPQPLLNEIASAITLKYGRKGQRILVRSPENGETRVIILFDGRCKLFQSSSSNDDRICDIIFSGDLYAPIITEDQGETLLIDSREAVFAAVPFSQWLRMINQSEELLKLYLEAINERIHKLEYRYHQLASVEVRIRVVRFLSWLAMKQGVATEQMWCFENFLTHQEIAFLLLTSRQSIFTALEALNNDGVLLYTRKKIEISSELVEQESVRSRTFRP